MRIRHTGIETKSFKLFFHLMGLLLSLLVLSGCDLPIEVALETPTEQLTESLLADEATATVAATATSPATTEAATIASDAAAPTPTPKETNTPVPEDSFCLPIKPNVSLEATSFESYPSAILNYLNAGGSVEALQERLAELEIGNDPLAATAGELTGDDKLEVVVSFINDHSQGFPPQGALLVFVCNGESYELEHYEISEQGFEPPAIIHIRDLNANGLGELITSNAICDAHTCYEDVKIWEWTPEGFQNRLNGTTIDLPFPDIQITDYEKDGVYQLEAAGSGPGSISAGPPRDRTRIFTYNAVTGFWDVTQEIPGPSNYRIHVLHDADAAVRSGDYTLAQVFYDQVINDPDLDDWMPEEHPDELLNLQAYARYKLVVVYTLMEQPDNAQRVFEAMVSLYAEDSDQRGYVEMAQTFLNLYTGTNLDAACDAVHQYAAINLAKVLTPLGQTVFGTSNLNYSPLDVCP